MYIRYQLESVCIQRERKIHAHRNWNPKDNVCSITWHALCVPLCMCIYACAHVCVHTYKDTHIHTYSEDSISLIVRSSYDLCEISLVKLLTMHHGSSHAHACAHAYAHARCLNRGHRIFVRAQQQRCRNQQISQDTQAHARAENHPISMQYTALKRTCIPASHWLNTRVLKRPVLLQLNDVGKGLRTNFTHMNRGRLAFCALLLPAIQTIFSLIVILQAPDPHVRRRDGIRAQRIYHAAEEGRRRSKLQVRPCGGSCGMQAHAHQLVVGECVFERLFAMCLYTGLPFCACFWCRARREKTDLLREHSNW